ncbi:MAG: hypothetical protein FJ039_02650 [Chloroflexi bacterium]|nr:hypothetical protein [Chloroflexota bacterium]
MDTVQQAGVTRKKFVLGAILGAAGLIGMGALAQRKLKTEESLPLGLPEDSIFRPRADALERMRKGLGK